MTATALRAFLVAHNACEDALSWIGDRDLASAWAECQRSDWMLWFMHVSGVTRDTRLRLFAADCADAESTLATVRLHAIGKASAEVLKAAFYTARNTREDIVDALEVITCTARDAAWDAAWATSRSTTVRASEAERAWQSDRLRHYFPAPPENAEGIILSPGPQEDHPLPSREAPALAPA